jgi:hypothetical protein
MDNKELFRKVCAFTGFSGTKKDMLAIEDHYNRLWSQSDESDLRYYATKEYVYIAYLSYVRYSGPYIRSVAKVLGGEHIGSVLDVGAGIGASTVLAQKLFQCRCYYQNIPSMQMDFAKTICNDQITLVDSISNVREADMILCLDLFEHIREPFILLRQLLKLNPKYLITSNSFGPSAFGHYSKFLAGGREIDRTQMPKEFSKAMEAAQFYTPQEFKHPILWNTRPRIWKNRNV